MMSKLRKINFYEASSKNLYLYLAWLMASVSTAGSLFLSYFMKLPPCDLCWYQRIFMFPLVFILWIGYSHEDKKVHLYSLPLIVVGWLIAAYHNLIYYKIMASEIIPCTSGISCTERQLNLFGFISIPLMSLVGFSILFILIYLHIKQQDKNYDKK